MVSNSLTLTTDLLAHTYNRIIQETWMNPNKKHASLIQNTFHLNTSEEIASGHIPIEYF